jgi:3-hydroxyacyl-CoA dehydrogenase
VPNPKVVDVVRAYLKEHRISPKKVGQQAIIDLMLAAAINEAAFMMEEGICDRPQDMDLAMIYGTGFPPYRGGILRYADQWGLANVLRHLLALEQRYGARFTPAQLIRDMAPSGKTFYKN